MRSRLRALAVSNRSLWDFLPDPIWTGIFLAIPASWLAIARLLQWWSA